MEVPSVASRLIRDAAHRPLARLYTREYHSCSGWRYVLDAGWDDGDGLQREVLYSTRDWQEFLRVVQQARRIMTRLAGVSDDEASGSARMGALTACR